MKWRQREGTYAGNYWECGGSRVGGEVLAPSVSGYHWSAWANDARSRNTRPHKTLKAAQRAVEKWLEKHG